jgi:hypothetical protein
MLRPPSPEWPVSGRVSDAVPSTSGRLGIRLASESLRRGTVNLPACPLAVGHQGGQHLGRADCGSYCRRFVWAQSSQRATWPPRTADGGASTNWETLARLRRTDTRRCSDCHGRTAQDYVARRPNFDGIDVSDAGAKVQGRGKEPETHRWREMDSNRRSPAEFGNFDLSRPGSRSP